METQLTLAMMNDELGQARTSKKEFLDKIERIIPWDTFVGMFALANLYLADRKSLTV